MQYILDRLKEPTSWLGFAMFLGMFGVDAEIIERLTANAPAVVVGIASLLAIVLPDYVGKTTRVSDNAATKPQTLTGGGVPPRRR